MQIFWVSGPVGKIHSFNLTIKTVAIAFGALGLFLVAIGAALQFFGFRMALEYDPEIARQLGNLHTASELEDLNAVYRNRLKEIDKEQALIEQRVRQTELAQQKLAATFVPVTIRSRKGSQALGGVEYPLGGSLQSSDRSMLAALKKMHNGLIERRRTLFSRADALEISVDYINALPVRVPVHQSPAYVSSEFGERVDPITKRKSFHSGVDFELPENTPIFASGSGVVLLAAYDSQYGNTIVIKHTDALSSRYAHANKLLVKEGEHVSAGQNIALSGNTGRSTGAHLHFEVTQNGSVVDPSSYVSALKIVEKNRN